MKTLVSAAVIEDGKLLIVKKRDEWMIPVSKPRKNESDLECLCRTFSEKLNGTKIKRELEFYDKLFGAYLDEGSFTLNRIYFVKLDGELKGYSGKISDIAWITDENHSDKGGYKMKRITKELVQRFKKEGRLKPRHY